MKKVFLPVLILSISAFAFWIGLSNDSIKNVEATSADNVQGNDWFHFNANIDLDGMKHLPTDIVENTKSKFGVSQEKLNKTMLEMALKLTPIDKTTYKGKATGAFKIGQRAHGYQVTGNFVKVTNSENGEVYYRGEVQGNIQGVNLNDIEKKTVSKSNNNIGFIIVFNANNPEDYYIASTVGYQSFGGTTIFGDKNVYENWQKAVVASGGELNWR